MNKLPRVELKQIEENLNQYDDSTKTVLYNVAREMLESFRRKPINDENTLKQIESEFRSTVDMFRMRMNKNSNEPFYKHDCMDCIWLGDFIDVDYNKKNGMLNLTYFDLYFHKRQERVEFIARYGDIPSEYFSFTYFDKLGSHDRLEQINRLCEFPPMREAYNRYKTRLENALKGFKI